MMSNIYWQTYQIFVCSVKRELLSFTSFWPVRESGATKRQEGTVVSVSLTMELFALALVLVRQEKTQVDQSPPRCSFTTHHFPLSSVRYNTLWTTELPLLPCNPLPRDSGHTTTTEYCCRKINTTKYFIPVLLLAACSNGMRKGGLHRTAP